MKRFLVFSILPAALFALERVNLVKDAGFEKDSDVWAERSIIIGNGNYDSTVYNHHDSDSVYIGEFCGSIDGRKKPSSSLPVGYGVEGYFYQVILYPKPLKDLDSLQLFHMPLFAETGNKYSAGNYGLGLYFTQPPSETFIEVWYSFSVPGSVGPPETPIYKSFRDTIGNEGEWRGLQRDIKKDLVEEKGMLDVTELDTFLLYEASYMHPSIGWRGQKAFFDGHPPHRLRGLRCGGKGDSQFRSYQSGPYTPVARIKNFGRQPADNFLVIAEAYARGGTVYADTIPYTLAADTEDTLEFATWKYPEHCTLTVRTVVPAPGLDESNEDDALSQLIAIFAVDEQPAAAPATLDVQSFTATPRIAYSLPQGQSGTISIYDASGRKVESMDVKGPGVVETSPLTSGVYFVKLETGKTNITRKTVVLR